MVRAFMLIGLIVFVLCFGACSSSEQGPSKSGEQPASPEKGDKKKQGKDKETNNDKETAETKPADGGSCDDELWKRVYNSERLEVKEQCKTVTGTIEERNADDDGDEHMLLKLDPGQDGLLTKKNEKKKDGNLVIEAVCVNPATLKKVGSTCDGFNSPISLPNVGDHVRVTGSYVVDSHNGWTEIHPISRIDIMQ